MTTATAIRPVLTTAQRNENAGNKFSEFAEKFTQEGLADKSPTYRMIAFIATMYNVDLSKVKIIGKTHYQVIGKHSNRQPLYPCLAHYLKTGLVQMPQEYMA